MEPFAADQIDCAGPSLEISPKHALALSLALHELATNAAKYGALSRPKGCVELRWARKRRIIWRYLARERRAAGRGTAAAAASAAGC